MLLPENHSCLDVITLVGNPLFFSFLHTLPDVFVNTAVLGGCIRVGSLSFLQLSSLITEVENVFCNPRLVLFAGFANDFLCSLL